MQENVANLAWPTDAPGPELVPLTGSGRNGQVAGREGSTRRKGGTTARGDGGSR